MKGLLMNEFISMRRLIALYVAIAVVYHIMGVFGSGMSGTQIFVIFFSAMLVIYSFSVEEKSDWTGYVNVLPVSRRQIVLSKYLMAVICVGISAGAGLLLRIFVNVKAHVWVGTGLWITAAAVLTASVFIAVIVPVLVKFGSEKSRIILILIFLIPFFTALLIEKGGIRFEFTEEAFVKLLPFIAIGVVVLLMVSYFITLQIYRRKEF